MSRLSENTHSFDRIQLLRCITQQFILVSGYILHPQMIDIPQRFCQRRTADIIGRTCFKLERQFIEGRLFKRNGRNHFTASLVRGKLIQPFFLSIQNTDTGRPVHLMSGEHVELGIQILYIHSEVGNSLRSVDQHRHIVLMRFFDHRLYRVNSSEHIGYVGYGNQAGTGGK